MIQIEKSEDGQYTTRELFTTEEFWGQTKSPILRDGYFYG